MLMAMMLMVILMVSLRVMLVMMKLLPFPAHHILSCSTSLPLSNAPSCIPFLPSSTFVLRCNLRSVTVKVAMRETARQVTQHGGGGLWKVEDSQSQKETGCDEQPLTLPWVKAFTYTLKNNKLAARCETLNLDSSEPEETSSLWFYSIGRLARGTHLALFKDS